MESPIWLSILWGKKTDSFLQLIVFFNLKKQFWTLQEQEGINMFNSFSKKHG